MKTLDNKVISFKDKPVFDENNVQLDTEKLLRIVLENSSYQNSPQVLKAMLILTKIKVEDNKINLEDADYDFIKQWSSAYQPLASKGVMFAEFFQQLQ